MTGDAGTAQPTTVRWWRRRERRPKLRPSAELVAATYALLLKDRAMVVLLLVGGVVAALAAGAVVVPAWHWGHVQPDWSQGGLLGVLVAGVAMGASSFVLQLVSGAVVAAALARAEGRPATVRTALAVAWGRRRQLLAWAAVSTLVGAAARSLERLGVGGLVAALTVDVGWAVGTVFATPVVIVEGTMPVATLRRSAALLRGRFTVTVLTSLTVALPWLLLGIACLAGGVAGALTLVAATDTAVRVAGAVLLALGVVGVSFVSALSSALSAYLEALLYRYALDLPVPGVEPGWWPPRRPA